MFSKTNGTQWRNLALGSLLLGLSFISPVNAATLGEIASTEGVGGSGISEGEVIEGLAMIGAFTGRFFTLNLGQGDEPFASLIFSGRCQRFNLPPEESREAENLIDVGTILTLPISSQDFSDVTDDQVFLFRMNGKGLPECYSTPGGEDLIITEVRDFAHSQSGTFGAKVRVKKVSGDPIPPALVGDFDDDGDVDRDDLNEILARRNQSAAGQEEFDLDGDGQITALDARKLVLLCTRARCATS